MPKPITTVEPKVTPDPKLEKRTRRVFTAECTLLIMQQANACKHGELSALLRREKLYSNQLAQWRREFAEQGVAGLKKSAPGPASKKSPEQKRVKQRENENQRLQRQYGSQRRLLNAQKKPWNCSTVSKRASHD